MNFRVGDIPDIFSREIFSNPFLRQNTFIRIWHKDSYTRYSESLGFLCSDWKNVKPAVSMDHLRKFPMDMQESLSNHLDSRKTSPWISVADDVGWILTHAHKWRANDPNSDCRVAIISVPEMDRLGILWERSDILVESVGMQRHRKRQSSGGVKYAWFEHYLVYGWIPAQCVIRVFPFTQYRRMCDERGITSEVSQAKGCEKLTTFSRSRIASSTKAS